MPIILMWKMEHLLKMSKCSIRTITEASATQASKVYISNMGLSHMLFLDSLEESNVQGG